MRPSFITIAFYINALFLPVVRLVAGSLTVTGRAYLRRAGEERLKHTTEVGAAIQCSQFKVYCGQQGNFAYLLPLARGSICEDWR